VIIAVGSDHAGYAAKNELVQYLRGNDHQVTDVGTDSNDPVDYPVIVRAACQEVRTGRARLAITICSTGSGCVIAANKITGIRAAAAYEPFTACTAVEHNNANVLCLGAGLTGPRLMEQITSAFISAAFRGKPSHRRRVALIDQMDRNREVRQS
jgi:ribose 5-phosphate isomerase B